MLENIVLIVISLGAVYYVYHSTFKSKGDCGCSCGDKKGSCSDKK
jgi:hypothetical protein